MTTQKIKIWKRSYGSPVPIFSLYANVYKHVYKHMYKHVYGDFTKDEKEYQDTICSEAEEEYGDRSWEVLYDYVVDPAASQPVCHTTNKPVSTSPVLHTAGKHMHRLGMECNNYYDTTSCEYRYWYKYAQAIDLGLWRLIAKLLIFLIFYFLFIPEDDCQSCNRNVSNKSFAINLTVQDLLSEFVQYGNMTLMGYEYGWSES